jgi:phosphopantothenoylcysteine synthetase/decarboxylase
VIRVVVTAGPSYEPIDDVRRLTNFSSGELGMGLADRLAADGFDVTCLRGAASTHPGPLQKAASVPFTTNDDLLARLQRVRGADVGAVFHAAALCDYRVSRVVDATGKSVGAAKIESRGGGLTIQLEPALKLIGELRALFPKALLVGWKYELVGARDDALAKAWRQIRDNRTDACVVNGRAYGPGFGVCRPPDRVTDLAGKRELIEFLSDWLKSARAGD